MPPFNFQLLTFAGSLLASTLLAGEDPNLSRANALLREGKPKEARAVLEALARESPQSAPVQYALAQEAILERDIPRATKHLERTIEIDPARIDARLVLASIYRKEKKPKDAEKQLKEVLKKDPQSAGAFQGLGELDQDGGRFEKAVEWYEKALARKPKDPRLAGLIAAAWTESVKSLADGPKKKRDQHGEKALAAYARLLELKPDLDEAHYNMATVDVLCERYDDAIRSLELYLEKRPEDPRGLWNLAQVEEKKGSAAEALDAWRRFIAAAEKGDAEVKADIPRARERVKALEKEAKKAKAKKS